MTVRQISTFLQSKPGHLARMLGLFQDAGVSVRGYSVSDTGDYGIGRFIVDDPDAAIAVLEREGAAHAETEVMAACGVNVSYSYSMISTYIIIKTSDVDAAKDALAATSLTLVSQEDIRRASALRAEGAQA